MTKIKKVWIQGQYRKIDMEQFARVLAMLVEEYHRARLEAKQDASSDTASPSAPQEA
jgi:hypothetical protein